MDDVTDVVATGEGEEGVPVGDIERFHGARAGEKRRDLGPPVRGDDDPVSHTASAQAVWAPIMPSPPVTRFIEPPRSGGG